MRESLAVSGLTCKPHVASAGFRQSFDVPLPLPVLFAKRLQEEMDERGLSDNALAKLAVVGQRSVSRILLPVGHKDRQVPSLELVEKLTGALDLPPWYFFMEADEAGREVIRPPAPPKASVARLPSYKPTFSSASEAKKIANPLHTKSRRDRRR